MFEIINYVFTEVLIFVLAACYGNVSDNMLFLTTIINYCTNIIIYVINDKKEK